jgi:tRNA (guanine37-N1)-methyltransferase
MKIDVLSLFPEMFSGVFNESILKKAQEQQKVSLNVVNFRDHSKNKHSKVDDYQYGGGAGMVLTPQPIFDAVEDVKANSSARKPRIILMTPQGEPYSQRKAQELAQEKELIFICGHYEGYDERIREGLVTDEISIGDYVLTGGELAAMAVIDSVVRLLPGVLGNDQSKHDDSFSDDLLEHPQYTRPADFRGLTVPDILLSGNHAEIEKWRRCESLRRTFLRRPELLKTRELTSEEEQWLKQFRDEQKK